MTDDIKTVDQRVKEAAKAYVSSLIAPITHVLPDGTVIVNVNTAQLLADAMVTKTMLEVLLGMTFQSSAPDETAHQPITRDAFHEQLIERLQEYAAKNAQPKIDIARGPLRKSPH